MRKKWARYNRSEVGGSASVNNNQRTLIWWVIVMIIKLLEYKKNWNLCIFHSLIFIFMLYFENRTKKLKLIMFNLVFTNIFLGGRCLDHLAHHCYPKAKRNSLKYCNYLKGHWHEIFELWFFHQSTPPRGLTNWGNSFLPIGHSSRRKSNFRNFRGVANIAEVTSAVYATSRKWCYTEEVTFAVYATSRKSLPGCMLHLGSHFCGVAYTAEVC